MRRDLLEPYERLVEAPWIHARHGRYYLFYSGDDCCSEDPAYAVMVARAEHPLGPYEKPAEVRGEWGANVVLHYSDRWVGPGHNAVVTDAAGTDWLVYHAIDPANPDQPAVEARKRPMLIDRIEWKDGWPRVARDEPSAGVQSAPVVR
jgi:arabinan endo-1,5-alpha-L-arabinosidase